MSIKTHTFNGRKYKIELVDRIDGVTDGVSEDLSEDEILEMMILRGDDIKALHSALHEGLEAIEADNIHGQENRPDGNAKTWDVARFLWRLGWRKVL